MDSHWLEARRASYPSRDQTRWSQPDSETQLGSETSAGESFSAPGRATFPCARRRQRKPLTAARHGE